MTSYLKAFVPSVNMAQEVLLSLSFIIAIAAAVTIIARFIKQPPIIAYLIAGVLVGPIFLNLLGTASPSTELVQTFAHIGVAFLLFIVGLSLDFRLFKEIGGVAVFGGLTEVTLAGVIGGIIALGLGFSSSEMIYIGAALAFSSTVVVVKLLSDKKEIDTLHGRIALGILIVEDFVAALALMSIPLIENGGSLSSIATKILLLIAVIIAVFLFSAYLLTRFLDYLARNQEVLFLFGIAWALILAALFDLMGFSSEIGALIAGMSLASSKYTLELGGKMKPLRDFFVVLFFVFFGSQLGSSAFTPVVLKQAAILSVFIIVGKPLIVMTVLRFFGYKKRTNFLTGTSLAQVSEFSLILALVGFTSGHLSQEGMSLIVLVAIITIGTSSYSIFYAHTIFSKIANFLGMFEGKHHRTVPDKSEKYDVFLFGYHRLGYKILQTLKAMKASVVVVDYNPQVVLSLGKQGINCIYGDASDADFLSQIGLENAKLVISTIPEEAANLAIQERLDKMESAAAFVATAEQPRQALDLYSKGVDYVIIPHHLGGDLMSTIISAFKTTKDKYTTLGKNHIKELKKAKNSSTFI